MSEPSEVNNTGTPWTPLVEVVRKEMMARFSNKLSMEEIASCAYAVSELWLRDTVGPLEQASADAVFQLEAAVGAFERNDALNWDDLQKSADTLRTALQRFREGSKG